jgi:nucleoside phosphorylase
VIDKKDTWSHIAEMHLITMAHLGEAQAVIDLFNLKKISQNFYEGAEISCLITGEGPFEAAVATAGVLARKEFEQLINIGVAGSLDNSLKLGEIYPVRSIYLVIDGRPQFKSFKSLNQGCDCITTFERILSSEKALPLTGVGQIVDREAWGVAMAAKNAQVPLVSYKLISDEAGTIGACEVVKAQAHHWSLKLAEKVAELLKSEKESVPSPIKLEQFHFTFSMQHQLRDLLQKISLREDKSSEEILESCSLASIQQENTSPKERARRLIGLLEERLDPLKSIINSRINEWRGPYAKENIQLMIDESWERAGVKISFEIQSKKELEHKLKVLASLELTELHKLQQGKLDVE